MQITDIYFTTLEHSNMSKYIHSMFLKSFRKEWYDTYFLIDLHGTIIKPDYKLEKIIEYYSYAKEAMQLISKRKDIVKIMWTCSNLDEINFYNEQFKKDNILFDKINENDNISSRNGNFGHYDRKMYANIIIDDKAAFDPEVEWKYIYSLFKAYETYNVLPDSNWTTKY